MRNAAYSLRYVYALVPLSAMVFYYAYFLGPWLTVAFHEESFRFLDEWIMGIAGWWTQDHSFARSVTPDFVEPLSINLGGWWNRNRDDVRLFLVVGAVLAAAMTTAFLWPMLRGDALPARQKVGPVTHLAIALAWGMVLLAAACMVMGHVGWYGAFTELGMDRTPRMFAPPPDPSPMPFLTSLIGAAILCWIILLILARRATQFWRLERLTFWVMIAAAAVLMWALGMNFFGNPQTWTRRWGSEEDLIPNVLFLSLSALCWAWFCRVVLLFNLARYERHAAALPDTACFACGYDLRGSLHSPTCPECGAKVVATNPSPDGRGQP